MRPCNCVHVSARVAVGEGGGASHALGQGAQRNVVGKRRRAQTIYFSASNTIEHPQASRPPLVPAYYMAVAYTRCRTGPKRRCVQSVRAKDVSCAIGRVGATMRRRYSSHERSSDGRGWRRGTRADHKSTCAHSYSDVMRRRGTTSGARDAYHKITLKP